MVPLGSAAGAVMLAGLAAPLIALGGDTTKPHPTWLVAGLVMLAVCAAGLTWTLTAAPWMHHGWVVAWLMALTLMVHGDEEFALALPDCTLEGAHAVLERLRTEMPLGQTVSIGLAQQVPSESVESLMARADRAAYEAKACGRKRICFADEASVAVT